MIVIIIFLNYYNIINKVQVRFKNFIAISCNKFSELDLKKFNFISNTCGRCVN